MLLFNKPHQAIRTTKNLLLFTRNHIAWFTSITNRVFFLPCYQPHLELSMCFLPMRTNWLVIGWYKGHKMNACCCRSRHCILHASLKYDAALVQGIYALASSSFFLLSVLFSQKKKEKMSGKRHIV